MKARTAIGLYGTTTGNEFLMLAKSLIQFRDNNANNFNIPHDFNLNFQTIEPRVRMTLVMTIRWPPAPPSSI